MAIMTGARRALTAALTATLLLAGGIGAAHASDSVLDPDRTARVTIHTSEQGGIIGAPADGLRRTDLETAPGLPGTTFRARHVVSAKLGLKGFSLNLATSTGWANASKLDYDAAAGQWWYDGQQATVQYGDLSQTASTGPAGGEYEPAVFESLPVGVYMFEEVASAGAAKDTVPWVMTVPRTHPVDRDSWLYDLHVYPKYSLLDFTKTVDDRSAAAAGDVIEWTMMAGVPRIAHANMTDEASRFLAPPLFIIKDRLDPRLVSAEDPVTVTLDGSTVGLVPSDYQIGWKEIGGSQEMTLTFLETGRARLGEAISLADDPEGVKVRVTIRSRLRSVEVGALGDGLISSPAELFTSLRAFAENTPLVSSEPMTKWGDVLLEKVDAVDVTKKLEGAEFTLHRTRAEALSGANPLTVGGRSVFTTGADGTVRIIGLRYSGWTQNGVVSSDVEGWTSYWAVEQKAPVGYELLTAPVEFTVDQIDQPLELATRIEGAPRTSLAMPLTGSTGTWFFTAAGALIVTAGVYVALRRKQPLG